MIHKTFESYLLKEKLVHLIVEARLEFSDQFRNILHGLQTNRIAREILDIYNGFKDANFTANYIDISDNKNDYVSYIPQNKADRILSQNSDIYKITNTRNILTFNKTQDGLYKNKKTFERLSYEPTEKDVESSVSTGDVCKIKSRVVNPSNMEYALIELGEVIDGKFVSKGFFKVIRITSIAPWDQNVQRLWKEQRTSYKIGKFAKAVLDTLNIQHTQKEIEDFVNLYKSAYDIFNSAFAKFDIVNGMDIAKWYNSENYENQKGQLGSSCMKNKRAQTFDIYTKNPEVCQLVILYSDDGKIVDEKYKSDKIKGRALLWKLEDGTLFLDRIYTNNDSDVELFKQFAQKQGFFYKKYQDSSEDFEIINAQDWRRGPFKCQLKKSIFDEYPYVDSLKFLSTDENIISNYKFDGADRILSSTMGEWYVPLDQ